MKISPPHPKRSLSIATHKRGSTVPAHNRPRRPKRQITSRDIFVGNGPPNAREVTMRASASDTSLGRLRSPQTPALTQFHSEPRPDEKHAVQTPDTHKPFFAKRTQPTRAAPTEVSFGPFRLLPTQFLLLEMDKPVSLGSRALEILTVLLERPGELVSKQELMARVWPNVFVEPPTLRRICPPCVARCAMGAVATGSS